MALPSISAQDQRRIERLISNWKGKLTWKLLAKAIELELEIKTTRQTLCTYRGIYTAYSNRKSDLRGVTPEVVASITRSDINAQERIARLEKEVRDLEEKNAQQLRMIDRIFANATAIPNLDLRDLVKERPEELNVRPKV
ncbi:MULTISPECIES: hypothetical protein [Spongiibacter]|jgi:hypothetical protein|uniref:Uncharacterized protein n=1 Tax=Spongiibacter pelagi TaxID=2760804 RepID=A0A927C0H5_9GAMM|nr:MULTISPECIES: hypothetical protein [Spongiibacter]MBN50936.1 hypothetical protein [Spongiibacteraceae bacterium]MAY37685.1 hypothetical protein [Spongiibacter sp.]MBD2859004.1 hypothetical protein [Spongiibacter pelagi]MBI57639.1 hypothetical protein [Spongiibacter sp.]MBU70670.1 hypothetical protein [Spongiibacter sp.]|tara:strand:+ start:1686 stop:2105 length:420 start_codon:yes stop_codon:yes gene_type:complete